MAAAFFSDSLKFQKLNREIVLTVCCAGAQFYWSRNWIGMLNDDFACFGCSPNFEEVPVLRLHLEFLAVLQRHRERKGLAPLLPQIDSSDRVHRQGSVKTFLAVH